LHMTSKQAKFLKLEIENHFTERLTQKSLML
jgi:hypothetical protein